MKENNHVLFRSNQRAEIQSQQGVRDGVDFYLRELSGKARLDFEGEKDLQLRVLKMMHASLCDENGKLTEKPEDFDAFMESVPNKVLLQLVNAFSALNITGETHLKN